jgi:hypothetical protein
LSIFAARAQLGFKRFTAFERLPACFPDPRHIIGIGTPNARVIGPYLFETESCEVQHERIRAESTSIRTVDPHGVIKAAIAGKGTIQGARSPSGLRAASRQPPPSTPPT